jgi:inorganic pyrophosphatase
MQRRNLAEIPTFRGKSTNLNVVIESPQGTSTKLDYDPEFDTFELSYVMPAGVVFPFEFGFVPSTLAEDGDPLDILILMNAPTCTGCILVARPVGVIEARQSERGRTFRNDRL